MMNKKKGSRPNEEPDNFQVPDNYFEESAKTIMKRIAWEEEHKDYRHLLNCKNHHGFKKNETHPMQISIVEIHSFRKNTMLQKISHLVLIVLLKFTCHFTGEMFYFFEFLFEFGR